MKPLGGSELVIQTDAQRATYLDDLPLVSFVGLHALLNRFISVSVVPVPSCLTCELDRKSRMEGLTYR